MSDLPVFVTAPKEPAEVIHIPGVDFGPRFTIPGETLPSSNVDISVFDRDDATDVTDWMLVPGSTGVSDGVVAFQIQNGSDNRDYHALIEVESSESRIERGHVIIPVRVRAQGAQPS